MNEWDKLSTYCVNASSENICKYKVATYVRREGLHIDDKLLDSRYGNGLLVHLPSGPLPWIAILLKKNHTSNEYIYTNVGKVYQQYNKNHCSFLACAIALLQLQT